MEFRNLSPKTIKMYEFYLSKYFDAVGKDDISTLTIQDAIDYTVALKKSNRYSPQCLNLIIATIRCFNELVLDIYVSRAKFPLVRYAQKEPAIFYDEEIQLLLSSTNDLQFKTMIFLGIDCGLRVSEVIRLKVSDINSKEGFILISESKRCKTRKVKLSNQCLQLLRQYWRVYRPNDWLFPSPHSDKEGNPYNACALNNKFSKYLKDLGLNRDNFHFHSLRHTYATHMLEDDCDVFVLKKLMGHKSFASTARYIHVTSKDIQNSFSPSDKRGYAL